jgi:RNA polymerase sigma factor (sigma-70 family)
VPVTRALVPTAGAPTLLADFVSTERAGLVRFAYLLCGDRHRAEDLVQDVLITLHRKFGAQFAVTSPVAYTRAAIVRANVNWYRVARNSEVPRPEFADVVARDDITDPDPIWAALRHLGSRERAVIVLRFHYDLPDAQIADLIDCRRGTVRSLASRALAQLRANSDVLAMVDRQGDPR